MHSSIHSSRRTVGKLVPDGSGAKSSEQTAGQALQVISSVIIRNIALSVSAEQLQDMLDRVGTVKSLTLVEGKEFDGESQTGVCEFEDIETATIAVEALDGTELDGMELKLVHCKKVAAAISEEVQHSFPSESSAAGQSSPIPGELFVEGLSQNTTSESLQAAFSKYGPCQARVVMDEEMEVSRGFGFVHFDVHEDAISALREEHMVDEQPVEVSQAFHGHHDSALPRIPRRLFIGGLAHNTTSETLQDAFSKYGACEAEVVIDEESGCSRGYGFLNFDSQEEVDAVLQEEEHIVDDTTVEVKELGAPTDERSDQEQMLKLLVGLLSPETTSDSLRAAFSKYGRCEAEVLTNGDGSKQLVGLVTFQTEDEARAALGVKSVDGQQVACSFKSKIEGDRLKRAPPATVPAILLPQAVPQQRLPNTVPLHGLQQTRRKEDLINALKQVIAAKGVASGPLHTPVSSRSAARIPAPHGMPPNAHFSLPPHALPQAAPPHPAYGPPPAAPPHLPAPQWPPVRPLQTAPYPAMPSPPAGHYSQPPGPPGSFVPFGHHPQPPQEPPLPPPPRAPAAPARPSSRAPSSRTQESLDNSSTRSSLVDAAPAVRKKKRKERVGMREADDSQGPPRKSSRPIIKPTCKPSLAPHLR